jgi:hypothetical protein
LDTVQALDHTIHCADEAARRFGVTPAEVADRLRDVHHLEEKGRSAYAAGTALGALVSIASAHEDDCGKHDCQTCAAIRDALAVNLAGLRTLRLEAAERRRWAGPGVV